MGDLIKCPIDGTALVMLADDGVAQTTCHACHRAYRLGRGTLLDVEMESSDENPGQLVLRLTLRWDDDVLKIADTMFAEGRPRFPEGGHVTTVEQLGPDGTYQLVEVRPKFGDPLQIREPGDRAAIRTVGLSIRGGLVTIFAMVLLMYFYHWAFFLVIVPGGLITTLIAVMGWRNRTTRQRVEPLQLERLEREQWLLGKLEHYRLQAEEVDARLARYEKQIVELRALESKMASADGDFEQRLQIVERGVQALQHHMENDRKLREAIESTMEMVEIEYRASRVLDHLPDDAIDRLSTSIAELDAIEAENQQLEAQLEANAEVNAIAPA